MFDAIQFCNDYNISYTTIGAHSSRGHVNINCPLPGHNDVDYFGGIKLSTGHYNCWQCGGHQLKYIIKLLLLISYQEAEEIIFNYSGLLGGRASLLLNTHSPRALNCELPGASFKSVHKKYLENRGFDPDILQKKYGVLGTTHIPDKYKYRIIIPIFHNNKLISFQGRDYTGKQKLRYKGLSPELSVMNYKHTLYGLEKTNGKQIGIVEGVFDQWRMGDGFVGSFGTALTNFQLKLLSRFERVFFLYDPEKQVQEKALNYAKQLYMIGSNTEIIDTEIDTDPGAMSESEARYLRRELNFV
jgi:hypothetical protein